MSFLDMSDLKEDTFGALPAGKYAVVSDTAEVNDTKAGTGKLLKVKFRVIEGPFEGRFIFQRFNTHNPSEKAQNIGRSQLTRFLAAAGHKNPKILESALDAVGYKVIASVKIDADTGYGESNSISSFAAYKSPQPKTGSPF